MCQIHTDDDKMSRQHFAIESTQLGFFIMDLETTNGTMLNGQRLVSRQRLNEGDVISAGREKFVFSSYKGE
jgi:pSer/pThr/pTyr-binding forkhead associated (FHA) protein